MKINKLSILRTVILLLLMISSLVGLSSGPYIPALKQIDLLWFSILIISSLMLTQDDQ